MLMGEGKVVTSKIMHLESRHVLCCNTFILMCEVVVDSQRI